MRLIDRWARRAGYWEGQASGAAVLSTTYGGTADREGVLPQLTQWAISAHGSSSPVFSAVVARILLLSQAVFQFQAKDDKHLFGTTDLAVLEEPWPDGHSSDLIARMELDRSLAGNAYIWSPPGEDFLVRLRPDWTSIISELVSHPGGGQYRKKLGLWVEPPKSVLDQGKGEFYPIEEVAHWAPDPDPSATFRGMSWLTPVYREVQGDQGMVTHKIRYLENAASPNLLIRYPSKMQPGTIDSLRERVKARYAGAENAFKTMIVDQGADVTIIGNSLQQMDFSGVASAGEQRILAASFVPGVLLGLEPLRGAGRGYQESTQKFANLFGHPSWQSLCGCLEKLIPGMPAGNRLWYDTTAIALLQDGELERGQAALVRGQALLTCRQAGYTRESAVAFVNSGDVTQLKVDPLAVPAAQGNVQHQLPQAQPGVTANPLPPANPRLPVGSTSPGDGGNGTRPIPQLSAGRRALAAGVNGSP